MSKNLSALLWLDENHPELAEVYREKVKDFKRARSRERQRLMAKAFAGSKEKPTE